ncbi:Flp family type IVb pilin [Aquibacillus sp. 3ASR75-11]|uniref:Flp family type IVb pilin n=1 Tax=Terrihalobacillus insolitus TaxID=2950438 RepID=A0A9X3WY19_9BACI|nr:Flp family type IVb pilin [Terrihalobacillus insolitus]MDC3413651.1 Flp family type IVb pilin [Terrihalobacillus insolitus]MDC3425474.1 Flp family type IVb pilin [Terrihalobacillus insolitus]
MMNKLKGLFTEEQGQGMTEYALVLGVIAVGVVTIIITLGDTIKDQFQKVIDKLTGTTAA